MVFVFFLTENKNQYFIIFFSGKRQESLEKFLITMVVRSKSSGNFFLFVFGMLKVERRFKVTTTQ